MQAYACVRRASKDDDARIGPSPFEARAAARAPQGDGRRANARLRWIAFALAEAATLAKCRNGFVSKMKAARDQGFASRLVTAMKRRFGPAW
jgi:hypothetical protein